MNMKANSCFCRVCFDRVQILRAKTSSFILSASIMVSFGFFIELSGGWSVKASVEEGNPVSNVHLKPLN